MLILTAILLIISTSSIGIPLHEGPRCMIIQGQFDPIKMEIKFPVIPNKVQGQKFKVTLIQYVNDEVIFDVLLDSQTIYRKNLQLPYNKIYQVCIQVFTTRNSFNPQTEKMYVEYIASQNFEALIGNFEVPPELVGQKNLQYIYNMSQSITSLNKKIVQNQKRERQIEQNMAKSNLDKNKRISMFTIIQCFVIVLSGLYQVLALRRFLIQKNLY